MNVRQYIHTLISSNALAWRCVALLAIAALPAAATGAARYSVTLQPDANVVSGETMIRFLLDAKRLVSDADGARLQTCRLPAHCSYPSTLPAILAGSGIEIAYHPYETISEPFYWKSPDGSIIYTRYLSADQKIPPEDSCTDVDIEVSPTRSGPFPAEASQCGLPNTLISTRHTSLENALTTAEKMWALAYVLGAEPPDGLGELWRLAYYPSSPDTYLRPSPKPAEMIFAAANAIADKIDTTGTGTPIVVFNTLSWTRTDVVDVASPFPGRRVNVVITDSNGTRCAGQSIGDRLYFTARDVPPMGYKLFWANRVTGAVSGRLSATAEGIIENEFFRVECSTVTGWVKRIYDKLSKRELLPPGRASAQLVVRAEKDGRTATRSTVVEGNSEVVEMLPGPARASLVSDQRFNHSQVTREITLYDGVPRIDFRFTVDWQEMRSGDRAPARLCAAFPAPQNAKLFIRDSLFGTVEAKADGTFAPSRHFAALSGSNGGLLVVTNGCPGFAYSGGAVLASLTQSLTNDDLVYDHDAYEMSFAIWPLGTLLQPLVLHRRSAEFNEPLVAVAVSQHKGSPVPRKSLISISTPNVVVTAFKKAQYAEAVVVRVRETDGKDTKARFTVRWQPPDVAACDMLETPTGESLSVEGNKFDCTIGALRLSSFLIPVPKK